MEAACGMVRRSVRSFTGRRAGLGIEHRDDSGRVVGESSHVTTNDASADDLLGRLHGRPHCWDCEAPGLASRAGCMSANAWRGLDDLEKCALVFGKDHPL